MIKSHTEKPNILVLGDLMIDHYLWGKCERISPEAPVQIVEIEKETSVLGGAGNVINNLKSLGANVDVISVIGDDLIADELKLLLSSIGVSSKMLIKEQNRTTSKKSRIMASQQQVLRYDKESVIDINLNSQSQIIDCFQSVIKNYSVVLFSDYGKGVFTYSLTKELIKIANKNHVKVLIDPKGTDYSKYEGAYLLTPNKKEAFDATKIKIKNRNSLEKVIIKLKDKCKLSISLITLSEKGIAIYDDNLRIYPTVAREVYDVTGAGDTVIASLGFSLACGDDIDKAVYFSNLAAGVVVGKLGSSTASMKEIIDYEFKINKVHSDSKIKEISDLVNLSNELQSKKKKIVFTNGCFDILHIGHVKYLEKAKSYGDILIVAVNSDESVKKIKGPTRPINSQNDRAYILASLEAVDYVVIFNEETPYKVIKKCKPHILVKGGDYKGKDVVGHDLVDELILVDFVKGKSTTNIIEKVKCNKE